MKSRDKYYKISELARRKGFFWPSYEIYGGVSGFITWGSLGSIMKRRVEDKFREMFLLPFGLHELESPIIAPEKVFEASGHIQNFEELMVECKKCNRKYRIDHLLQEFCDLKPEDTDRMGINEVKSILEKNTVVCPECAETLSEPKNFLTMFKTLIGPYSNYVGYGRPEAAQGIFVEFKRLYEQTREKLPMGFATIGHALRNEISPRQGPVRLREFTIIDLEFFIDPKNPGCPFLDQIEDEKLGLLLIGQRQEGSEKITKVTVKESLKNGYILMEWQAFFMALAKKFLKSLGIPEFNQRFIEKYEWERAHYSIQGFDQEVFFESWGWVEVSGFNYRTDFDLKSHMIKSGIDMKVFKENDEIIKKVKTLSKPLINKMGPTFKKNLKQVITLLSEVNPKDIENDFKKKGYFMIKDFKILPEHISIIHEEIEERGRRFIPHVIEPSFGSDRITLAALEHAYRTKNGRTILSLPRDIAPIQIAILPLVNKNGLFEKAQNLYHLLIKEGFMIFLDDSGSIGRRYARFDEIGTPLCITIDYETLKDQTVTIRNRDTRKQIRVNIQELLKKLFDYFRFKIEFEKMGKYLEKE